MAVLNFLSFTVETARTSFVSAASYTFEICCLNFFFFVDFFYFLHLEMSCIFQPAVPNLKRFSNDTIKKGKEKFCLGIRDCGRYILFLDFYKCISQTFFYRAQ